MEKTPNVHEDKEFSFAIRHRRTRKKKVTVTQAVIPFTYNGVHFRDVNSQTYDVFYRLTKQPVGWGREGLVGGYDEKLEEKLIKAGIARKKKNFAGIFPTDKFLKAWGVFKVRYIEMKYRTGRKRGN